MDMTIHEFDMARYLSMSEVRNDEPPSVTGNDGLQPVLIGLAALKSYRENKPVKIEEIANS